jgi:hypothetical protein
MNEKSTFSEVIMSPLPSQAVIVNPLAETLLVHEDTLLYSRPNNHKDTNP